MLSSARHWPAGKVKGAFKNENGPGGHQKGDPPPGPDAAGYHGGGSDSVRGYHHDVLCKLGPGYLQGAFPWGAGAAGGLLCGVHGTDSGYPTAVYGAACGKDPAVPWNQQRAVPEKEPAGGHH